LTRYRRRALRRRRQPDKRDKLGKTAERRETRFSKRYNIAVPITRRSFLDAASRAATAAAAARLLPFSTIVIGQEIDRRRLTVHSDRPQDIETPPHLLTSWITPNDLFARSCRDGKARTR